MRGVPAVAGQYMTKDWYTRRSMLLGWSTQEKYVGKAKVQDASMQVHPIVLVA
jgi:hypothetical protein